VGVLEMPGAEQAAARPGGGERRLLHSRGVDGELSLEVSGTGGGAEGLWRGGRDGGPRE
jgi:hypothetical protein